MGRESLTKKVTFKERQGWGRVNVDLREEHSRLKDSQCKGWGLGRGLPCEEQQGSQDGLT